MAKHGIKLLKMRTYQLVLDVLVGKSCDPHGMLTCWGLIPQLFNRIPGIVPPPGYISLRSVDSMESRAQRTRTSPEVG